VQQYVSLIMCPHLTHIKQLQVDDLGRRVIRRDAMKLAVAVMKRSLDQVACLHDVDLNDLPIPKRTEMGQLMLEGGYVLSRYALKNY